MKATKRLKKVDHEIAIPRLGSICMLCQERAPIRNSHLWPKFAVKWLKENSSPYIRRADKPNLRMQDVTKFPMLCTECENKFSVFEDIFSERIFKPYQANHRLKDFHYGWWLSHFAISLVWRLLCVEFADFETRSPVQREIAIAAFEHWRLYLIGDNNAIRPYTHHLFFFSYAEPWSSGINTIPENYHSYVHRSFDGAIPTFNEKAIAYVLLPGMAFWSPLHPHDDKLWPSGSAIRPRGVFKIAQNVRDDRFGQLINESAALAYAVPISEKQQALVQKDGDKFLSTKSAVDKSKILKPSRYDRQLQNGKINRIDKLTCSPKIDPLQR